MKDYVELIPHSFIYVNSNILVIKNLYLENSFQFDRFLPVRSIEIFYRNYNFSSNQSDYRKNILCHLMHHLVAVIISRYRVSNQLVLRSRVTFFDPLISVLQIDKLLEKTVGQYIN
jgi:hypothetical protein